MPDPIPLHFQHIVYGNAATLVPGGGAEVVPAANTAWFANNGFQPAPTHSAYFYQQIEPDYPQQNEPESASAPFQFNVPVNQPVYLAPPEPPQLDLDLFVARQNAPPPPFPVYSASGFDLLSILARVATRPYPRVVLGPVDLTCSFVVVDVRRYDHPIVYCSPTFCALTGYSEAEVVGRNCRFLQAPGGVVARGEPRKFTSPDAVAHLRKSLVADKECQTSIVNYKKDGTPFLNLVTVIPIPGGVNNALHEEHEYVYQVGFQVDLKEQPNAILENLRNGSYVVNYAAHSDLAPGSIQPPHQPARDRKVNSIPPIVMSKELKHLLADPAFIRSVPITTSTTIPAPSSSSSATTASHEDSITGGSNHFLHLVLLELAPAFVHVVSLKGSFLYVAPSVRRILGYEPEEMVGTSISDYAHPEDVVPLMRELKESSAVSAAVAAPENEVGASNLPGMPRSVDLLFRAKTKMGRYVWVECRGRLHAEPGKGRKAIILSGRAREMMNLKWEDVNRAGGLARGLRVPTQDAKPKDGKQRRRCVDQEVWGMLSGEGKETMVFASVGKGVEDVLGWTEQELLGHSVLDVLLDEGAANMIGGFVTTMRTYQKQQRLPSLRAAGLADGARVKKVRALLRKKDGGVADVWFIVYRADPEPDESETPLDEAKARNMTITPAPLVYQIRLIDAATVVAGSDTVVPLPPLAKSNAPPSTPLPSSSSLAGAVQPSPSLPVSPSTESQTSAPSSSTVASVDMFEELAIARGSSWQYELQQLRFANARLQEELVALEEAEAAGAGVGTSDPSTSTSRKTSDVAITAHSAPWQDILSVGYSCDSSLAGFMDQSLPPPQLFLQQQQQHYPPNDYTTHHQQNQTQSPYSMQAMPGVAPVPSVRHQLPLPQQKRRVQQRPIHPRPPNLPVVQQGWNGVMTTAPLEAVTTPAYANIHGGSSLKRRWDVVEP